MPIETGTPTFEGQTPQEYIDTHLSRAASPLGFLIGAQKPLDNLLDKLALKRTTEKEIKRQFDFTLEVDRIMLPRLSNEDLVTFMTGPANVDPSLLDKYRPYLIIGNNRVTPDIALQCFIDHYPFLIAKSR